MKKNRMDARKRNIVVGSIFLAAVLVIFVPMLFDKPVQITTEIDDFENPQIELPDLKIEEPSVDAVYEAGAKLDTLVDADGFDKETGVRVGEPELTTEVAETKRWAVQLASFANEESAQNLVDQCLAAGDQAWLSVAKVDGKTMHRVAVGPFLRRDDAEDQSSTLETKYDIKPMIVAYRD
ncbi:MAG: SPOR domain-containing protein [Gammaproteobacteria bacterium]|nr:SPOR domain-containing protein [Gammaproteobacteria bacterium]MYC26323.1 SPOR domain-containing protein [Gammaproteobacteria bacterium]